MVEIKNKDLQFFLETSFKKPLRDFTEEDLLKVEVLVYDVDSRSEDHSVSLEDLEKFPQAKKIVLSDAMITRKNLQDIHDRKIPMVRFNRCAFDQDEDLSLLSSLESLELIASFNDSYDFLKDFKSLQYLAIANPFTDAEIDLSPLGEMPQLKDIVLQRCLLENFSVLTKCHSVETLNVLWSKMPNEVVSVLNGMKSLKKLYITEGFPLNGLRSAIDVKHHLNEFLFEREKEKLYQK